MIAILIFCTKTIFLDGFLSPLKVSSITLETLCIQCMVGDYLKWSQWFYDISNNLFYFRKPFPSSQCSIDWRGVKFCSGNKINRRRISWKYYEGPITITKQLKMTYFFLGNYWNNFNIFFHSAKLFFFIILHIYRFFVIISQ